ncbi:Integrase-like protein [Gossypium australe]|uniref:Integrase-like protein n=1 Tax=Gossypium australe TaxID=47621 RepID=A0A5B6WNX7_9ROSI|nr:Integrase-like protein [Gossypium australe]
MQNPPLAVGNLPYENPLFNEANNNLQDFPPPPPQLPANIPITCNERTLREYALPNLDIVQRSITRLAITTNNFEIKPAMIQMIQNNLQFRDTMTEDPNQHIKRFLHLSPKFITLQMLDNELDAHARSGLDAATGGALINRTYEDVYELIENMAVSSCQWPTKRHTYGQKQSTKPPERSNPNEHNEGTKKDIDDLLEELLEAINKLVLEEVAELAAEPEKELIKESATTKVPFPSQLEEKQMRDEDEFGCPDLLRNPVDQTIIYPVHEAVSKLNWRHTIYTVHRASEEANKGVEQMLTREDSYSSLILKESKLDDLTENWREQSSKVGLDDTLDARIRPNFLRICTKNNMRVPNYTPNMFGPTHPKQEEDEHESNE